MELVDGAMANGAHWDVVYATKRSDEVSWFQDPPRESLRLVITYSNSSDSIIDVGAGASRLVDELIARGYRDVTLLDVSGVPLDEVRERLRNGARHVATVIHDVTSWSPPRTFRVWHDRAVFHFLTTPELRDAYVVAACRAVEPGGILIIGTFGPTGPTSCSGLAVTRHSEDSLVAAFATFGSLIEVTTESHVTPGGGTQEFIWAAFRRST